MQAVIETIMIIKKYYYTVYKVNVLYGRHKKQSQCLVLVFFRSILTIHSTLF